MLITQDNLDFAYKNLRVSATWNLPTNVETKMHRIHMYPAKFPSFLVTKTISHVREKKVDVKCIADIFCGCGTTALESKLNNINFWGCDINPVATLIAKVKSKRFSENIITKHFLFIKESYAKHRIVKGNPFLEDERICYWFDKKQIKNLYRLKNSIKQIPSGKYQDFFLVGFSNILKGASRWLTKSIKPTIDPHKKPRDVWESFEVQIKSMKNAVSEIEQKVKSTSIINIENKNFLKIDSKEPFVDLLITSPPYVTSYEYADLHQLSTLWLSYTKDFKKFRNGTIGSLYHKQIKPNDIICLNSVGKDIYEKMQKKDKGKASSVAKYFLDIKSTIRKAHKIIKANGYISIVIGNTMYKNVKIDNTKYVIQCLLDLGFTNLELFKRRISSKMLTPYRDKSGRFTNDKRKRKVYAYEFIIMGEKPDGNC